MHRGNGDAHMPRTEDASSNRHATQPMRASASTRMQQFMAASAFQHGAIDHQNDTVWQLVCRRGARFLAGYLRLLRHHFP